MLNRYACILAAGLVVAGCASPTSSRYEGAEVGRPIETTRGTIVSGRVVDVIGETNPAGPLAGAAIGGAGVGLGTHSGWAAILGAVFGAGIGYATQQIANDREGIEYVVEMEDGRTVTLVQNRGEEEVPLQSGTTVLVQLGSDYSRVIPRTPPVDRADAGATSAGASTSGVSGAASGAGGGWVDPDKPAAAAKTPAASSPAGSSPSATTTPQSGQPQGDRPSNSQTAPGSANQPQSANQLTPGPLASRSISSWTVPPTAQQ